MKLLILWAGLAIISGCNSGSTTDITTNADAGCIDPTFSPWLGTYVTHGKVNGYCESALIRRMTSNAYLDIPTTNAEFCNGTDIVAHVNYITVNNVTLFNNNDLYQTSTP